MRTGLSLGAKCTWGLCQRKRRETAPDGSEARFTLQGWPASVPVCCRAVDRCARLSAPRHYGAKQLICRSTQTSSTALLPCPVGREQAAPESVRFFSPIVLDIQHHVSKESCMGHCRRQTVRQPTNAAVMSNFVISTALVRCLICGWPNAGRGPGVAVFFFFLETSERERQQKCKGGLIRGPRKQALRRRWFVLEVVLVALRPGGAYWRQSLMILAVQNRPSTPSGPGLVRMPFASGGGRRNRGPSFSPRQYSVQVVVRSPKKKKENHTTDDETQVQKKTEEGETRWREKDCRCFEVGHGARCDICPRDV